MSTNIGAKVFKDQAQKAETGWPDLARKSGLFTLFLLCFVVALILGDNHQTTFPTNRNLYYEGATTLFFLAAALVLRRMPRYRDYWQFAYAFFAATAVLLVTTLTVDLRDALFRGIGIVRGTNQAAGAGKVFEAFVTSSDLYDAHQNQPVSEAAVIKGFAGSSGIVEGVVRRMDGPEDGYLLQQGEILVTVTTNIGWTPLFPRLAAIVTDVGAPLSHAAIVARELGIPAVVGCGNATMRLMTGDRVHVDGGRGVVEIL